LRQQRNGPGLFPASIEQRERLTPPPCAHPRPPAGEARADAVEVGEANIPVASPRRDCSAAKLLRPRARLTS
jgi:hypothetical protein